MICHIMSVLNPGYTYMVGVCGYLPSGYLTSPWKMTRKDRCFLMIYLLNNGDSPVRYVKSPEGNNAHTDKHISLDTLSDKPKTNPTNPRHRTWLFIQRWGSIPKKSIRTVLGPKIQKPTMILGLDHRVWCELSSPWWSNPIYYNTM